MHNLKQLEIIIMTKITTEDTRKFWDDLYAKRDQVWSGKPNVQLTKAVESVKPGTALDLGCGEGGDVVWLAQKGWKVTATDVSPVALERSKALAAEHGVADNIDFEQHDFAISFPEEEYDLVSAQFLQSSIDFDRSSVLKRAAEAVVPGGLLLIVEHGSAPSWSSHSDMHFPTAQETFDSLELDDANWKVLRIDSPERQITGPMGERATIKDNVIIVSRLS